MLDFLEPVRDLTGASILLRMLLACVCGGLVGIEREFKRRPAGFRTHILICLGATMTTMTSQFLAVSMGSPTDIGRLGAQVVAGVGFIGAGTIIVTRRQRVKGLTTAAGLWASAIMGLALGAGFYEGGILAAVLILVAEVLFSLLEFRILNNTPEISLLIEYTDKKCLDRILKLYREQKVPVTSMEITRDVGSDTHNACAIFSLRLHKRCKAHQLTGMLYGVEGVKSVEEV